MELSERQQILSDLIENGEKDKAINQLKIWASQSDYRSVIFEILEPVLIEWGKLWMQGKLSLAHGYLSGKVAEGFYMEASKNSEFNQQKSNAKGTIILGNIEDDFHPLGRRLVNIYSQSAGWNIIDLGNDVTAEMFVENAIDNNADIIAVSAMMFTTAQNISKVRSELDKKNLSGKVKLAVGGAVFKLRPELVQQVGGDGTAETAIDAPALFNRLLMNTNA